MSDDPPAIPPDDEPPREEDASEAPRSQQVRHHSVGARVPEHVVHGVFSTGVVVLQSTHEFILDFLLRMTNPQQVAARVVLSPPVVAGLLRALKENLGKYEAKFGPPRPPQPLNPSQGAKPKPPSAEDLYDDLKLPDAMLSGSYANAVMITHTGTEFCLDFLTTFFPRSAVSCRVFLAAPNVPAFLNSLEHAFAQFQQRQRQGGQHPPDDDGPTPPVPPPESF